MKLGVQGKIEIISKRKIIAWAEFNNRNMYDRALIAFRAVYPKDTMQITFYDHL